MEYIHKVIFVMYIQYGCLCSYKHTYTYLPTVAVWKTNFKRGKVDWVQQICWANVDTPAGHPGVTLHAYNVMHNFDISGLPRSCVTLAFKKYREALYKDNNFELMCILYFGCFQILCLQVPYFHVHIRNDIPLISKSLSQI